MDEAFARCIVGTLVISFCFNKSIQIAPRRRCVVGLCTLILIFVTTNRKDPYSAYSILGVHPTASEAQIKQSYRALSKKFHPDLNNDPGAHEKFRLLTAAHDVLQNEELRKAYHKFGDCSGNYNCKLTEAFPKVVLTSILSHCSLFIVGWWCTACPTKLHSARQFFGLYTVFAVCLDLLWRYSEEPVLEEIPGVKDLLPYEKCRALRSLTPFVMSVSVLIASLMRDGSSETLGMIKAILQTNAVITEGLNEIARNSSSLAGGSAASRRSAADQASVKATPISVTCTPDGCLQGNKEGSLESFVGSLTKIEKEMLQNELGK